MKLLSIRKCWGCNYRV